MSTTGRPARPAGGSALPGASTDAPGAAGEPLDASFGILHGLYWLCAALADGAPLVLAVDDAHWADAPSLRFLAFLVPRLEELPVTVLVAASPDPDADVAPLLGVLRGDRAAQVLRPAALSAAAVGDLITERLERVPAPAFAAACHAATGGLPFLVRELLAAVAEEGVEPVASAAPGIEALGGCSIRRSIGLRLARLPASAAGLARALAVLETAELAQVAALAELTDDDDAAAAADLLVAAGIVEPRLPLAFVHPVVREAILAEVPAPRRARAHRQAAELLAARDVPDERVAEHLLATEPAGETWVVERLAAAARTATSRGAPDCAATYLRRALAEPPPIEARGRLLLDLGLAETSAGQGAGEARLREAFTTATDDEVRLPAALALAHLLGRAERIAEAVEVVDAAAASLADATGPSRLAAGGDRARGGHAGRRHGARDDGRGWTRCGAPPDDPAAPREMLGVATLVALHRNEPATAAIALAQRALAAGPRIVPDPTDLPWFSQATIALLWADAHHQAQVPLDAGIAEGRRRGDPVLLSTSLAHRSWLLLRRGDLTGAEADARAVLETADLGDAGPVPQGGDGDPRQRADRAGPAGRGRRIPRRPRCRGDREHPPGGRAAAGARPAQAGRAAAGRGARRRPRGRRHRDSQRRPQPGLPGLAVGGGAGPRRARRARGRARGWPPRRSCWRAPSAGARTLGVALRTAGVVTGGDEGEALLRESMRCFEQAGVGARARPGAGGAGRAAAPRQPPSRGAGAAGRGARHRAPGGRRDARGARRDGAARHGCAAAARDAARRRLPDGERAAGRRAGGGRPHEPRDRAGPVRDDAHGRGASDARVREARRHLAAGAAGAPLERLISPPP